MTATTLVAPISLSTDLLTGAEWSPAHTRELLHLSADIKARPVRYASTLHGKCIALIFEKPSLRTRVTFDVGIQSMGGAVVFLDHTQASASLGKRESIADVARNLDRWTHCIVARTFRQQTIDDLARSSGISIYAAARARTCGGEDVCFMTPVLCRHSTTSSRSKSALEPCAASS